ncbi:MAG TPA: phosphatase PAP2 family protein [Bacteroidales bacterium]|nr:phosphatase PAP2 family protein [Bacteroidales bacterium]HPS71760.1 phosphatase PAP2 family protein [Bacteroidales bacterium]
MQEIIQLDQTIFLALNGLHANWLDPIIYILTQTWFWLPLYLLVVYLIIKKYRNKSYIPLLFLILAVTLSDQTCNLIKNTTERPRPSREITLQDQIHLYQKDDGNFYKGGKYGFPSAHSSNSMVLAIFILIFIAHKKRWIIMAAFCWSLFLGYTRIYLGVHYPFDVLTGFTLGFIISYPLFRWAEKRVTQ